MIEIIPTSIDELDSAISKVQSYEAIYRGVKDSRYKITSSLARGNKEDKSFNTYNRAILSSEEVVRKLGGLGDPKFETTRHANQNYHKSNIKGIESHENDGSPLIDFTLNIYVALFFAIHEINYKTPGLQAEIIGHPQHDAAVYIVVNREIFKTYKSFMEISENSNSNNPCIISPDHVLNNANDQKPKNQEAIYVVQIDPEISVDLFLIKEEQVRGPLLIKVILKKELFDGVSSILDKAGFNLNYLLPPQRSYCGLPLDS